MEQEDGKKLVDLKPNCYFEHDKNVNTLTDSSYFINIYFLYGVLYIWNATWNISTENLWQVITITFLRLGQLLLDSIIILTFTSYSETYFTILCIS